MRFAILLALVCVFMFPNTSCADVRIEKDNSVFYVQENEHVALPDVLENIFRGALTSTNRWRMLFEVPVDGRISSIYGMRKDPFSGRMKFHAGIDFANRRFASVHAAAKGIVNFSGWTKGCGMTIVIVHGFGIQTKYCHLDGVFVTTDEKVETGQTIAKMGQTGRATGSHLHFEVIENGRPSDPAKRLAIVGDLE